MDKKKSDGRVYTPVSIVNMILDYAGYISGDYIKKKHIIDNSCGDGQILCGVIKRYIESFIDDGEPNMMLSFDVVDDLKTYIHGIELDDVEVEKCKSNLNSVLKSYGISPIDWDIRCGNALMVSDFTEKMDFVIGNPPYVRMKNIKQSDGNNDNYQMIKSYGFSSKGMSDLYLAFYELGLSMLKPDGVLCYIAPGSWVNSLSGEGMRDYIKKTRTLSGVIDFGHIQVFENAQTYVMIALFDKSRPHAYIRYDAYSENEKYFYPVDVISYEDVFIGDKMFFGNRKELELIRNVTNMKLGKVVVKNGYATLADDIFIDNLPEFEHYTIPVIKASTGQKKRCLFPYDENLKLISLNRIKETDMNIYDYLIKNQDKLKNRTYDLKSIPNTWHSIGRSQGLSDTYKEKIAINSIVKCVDDLKLTLIKEGEGVYGGLYIMSPFSFDFICSLLKTDEFIDYVKSLKKYKSGGYYTFSSKDLENYMNYKLSK